MILKLLTSKLGIIAISAILLFSAVGIIHKQSNHISSLRESNARITNNYNTAMGLLNDEQSNTRVLNLTVADLRHSNDSLINRLNKVIAENEIAYNRLKSASAVSIEFVDTIKAEIAIKADTIDYTHYCDFDTTLMHNPETSIQVKFEANTLTVLPHITSDIDLIVWSERKYVNDRTFFGRIFHWDWAKYDDWQYKLSISNAAIRARKVRVVNITDK
jgi:hypothetical protein